MRPKSNPNPTPIQIAIAHAEAGMPVFPVDRATGEPLHHSGVAGATTDIAAVRLLWDRWPDADTAVRTGGRPEGSGELVIEFEGGSRAKTIMGIYERRHGRPPGAKSAWSYDGGRFHVLPHNAESIELAERIRRALDRQGGLDGFHVHGDGGFVRMAPMGIGERFAW